MNAWDWLGVALCLAIAVCLGRVWWLLSYRRQLARRVSYAAALERSWRLRVSVDGSPVLDATLEQLRCMAAMEGRPAGLELGIPATALPRSSSLVHVSLRGGLPAWLPADREPVP